MRRIGLEVRITTSAFAGMLLLAGLATPAPAQQAGAGTTAPAARGERPWIGVPSVERSQEPGITDLGRSPPNELHGESTDALQSLIEDAHEGEAEATGEAVDEDAGVATGSTRSDPPPIRPLR